MKSELLNGKNVLLIGACGLIGKSLVDAIYSSGAILILSDVDNAALEILGKECKTKFDKDILTIPADINDRNSLLNVIQIAEKNKVRIDSIVNVSYPKGRGYGDHVEHVKLENFCKNVSLHVGGFFQTMQIFSHYLSKNSGGNIINFASIYGTLPPKFEIYQQTNLTTPIEYAAIKAAIIQMTKYFATYYKKQSVRLNCISPGGIADNQPAEFIRAYNENCGNVGILDKKAVNGMVISLLSDSTSALTGQNIIIDDGFSL